jgi:hypothetical protein
MGNSIERARNLNDRYVYHKDRINKHYTMYDYRLGIFCFEKLPTWYKLYNYTTISREHYNLKWIYKKSFPYYKDFLDISISEWIAINKK